MINDDDGDEPKEIQKIHSQILFDVIESHWTEIQQDRLTDHRWFSSRWGVFEAFLSDPAYGWVWRKRTHPKGEIADSRDSTESRGGVRVRVWQWVGIRKKRTHPPTRPPPPPYLSTHTFVILAVSSSRDTDPLTCIILIVFNRGRIGSFESRHSLTERSATMK